MLTRYCKSWSGYGLHPRAGQVTVNIPRAGQVTVNVAELVELTFKLVVKTGFTTKVAA